MFTRGNISTLILIKKNPRSQIQDRIPEKRPILLHTERTAECPERVFPDSVICIGVKWSCTVKKRIPSGRVAAHSHETVGKYAFEESEYSACFSIELLIKQRGEKCQWFHCPSAEFGLWCRRKTAAFFQSNKPSKCHLLNHTREESRKTLESLHSLHFGNVLPVRQCKKLISLL